jgi:hypothetical protein
LRPGLFAKRERERLLFPRRLLAELLVLGGLIIAMSALGPFGSYTMPAGERLAHWAFFLLTGYVFFRPVTAAGTALASQSGLPRSVTVACACLFGALPTSLVVALAIAGFSWREVTVGDLAAVYAQVLIVGATVTVVQLLARRASNPVAGDPTPLAGMPLPGEAVSDGERVSAEEAGVGEDPGEVQTGQAAFLDLLPAHLGREVICLENEDHYVRVHTPVGSAMILMRMRDAVAQLEGRGERVHRSWWVAREAVIAVVRDDRNLKLRLQDGREVPVARASIAVLRDKGWLQRLSPEL